MRNGSYGPRLSAGSRGDTNPLEGVAVWTLGGLIVLGVLFWASGQLSGRLFGGSWPHVPVSEMGTVLLALPRHVGDPSEAWPVHARALIPGPAAFYGTLVSIILPVAGVASLVVGRI